MSRLGVIAGGGELPVAVAEACAGAGRDFVVARVAPFADPALERFPGATHNLGEMGARLAFLKSAGCASLTFVGHVSKPDFSSLTWDAKGQEWAMRFASVSRQGDDALLRALIAAHEAEGFRVVGAEEAAPELLAPAGALGAQTPDARALADIAQAALVVAAIGALDIGQGAVVCDGVVLAVEAQEGTDAMLRRVGELPAQLRGGPAARRGVLAKRPKPIQERRIDLPVIGVHTIAGAAAAGLAGVAVEAGAALIVDRAAVAAAADAAGLFVYGFTAAEIGAA